MRLFPKLFFLLIACLPFSAAAISSVNVMADNSLSVAMSEIARGYARENAVIVNASFALASVQQQLITEGEAADILITPRAKWIEELKMQGLIDVSSQTPIATGQLALVGPPGSPLAVDLSQQFPVGRMIMEMDYEPGFVVGHPETQSESMYVREALHTLNVAGDLEPYTLYIKQPSQMLEMIRDRQSYGVFLYSEVKDRPDVRVLDVFPKDTHASIQYYAVVIAGENMIQARKFLEYLQSAGAKRILRQSGFIAE